MTTWSWLKRTAEVVTRPFPSSHGSSWRRSHLFSVGGVCWQLVGGQVVHRCVLFDPHGWACRQGFLSAVQCRWTIPLVLACPLLHSRHSLGPCRHVICSSCQTPSLISEGPAVERGRNWDRDSLVPACLSPPDINSDETGRPAETLPVSGNWVRSGDLIEVWPFVNRRVPAVVSSLFITKACLQTACLVLLPSSCFCHIAPSPPHPGISTLTSVIILIILLAHNWFCLSSWHTMPCFRVIYSLRIFT